MNRLMTELKTKLSGWVFWVLAFVDELFCVLGLKTNDFPSRIETSDEKLASFDRLTCLVDSMKPLARQIPIMKRFLREFECFQDEHLRNQKEGLHSKF